MGDEKKTLDLSAYLKYANVEGKDVEDTLRAALQMFPRDHFVASCVIYYDSMKSLTRKQYAVIRSKVLGRRLANGELNMTEYLKPKTNPQAAITRKIHIMKEKDNGT